MCLDPRNNPTENVQRITRHSVHRYNYLSNNTYAMEIHKSKTSEYHNSIVDLDEWKDYNYFVKITTSLLTWIKFWLFSSLKCMWREVSRCKHSNKRFNILPANWQRDSPLPVRITWRQYFWQIRSFVRVLSVADELNY